MPYFRSSSHFNRFAADSSSRSAVKGYERRKQKKRKKITEGNQTGMFSLNLRLLITSCSAIDFQHTSSVCFTYHLKSISCNENMKKYSQSSQLTDALIVFGVVAALRNTRHDSVMLITFLERVIYSFLRFGDASVDGDWKISINFQPTSLVSTLSMWLCSISFYETLTLRLAFDASTTSAEESS